MPSKLQSYTQMAESVASGLTGSYQRWTAFLTTAARLYKYPFPEQMMIFAQRPDATACADYDLWNHTMRRYVRRGSKGIALIDDSGDRPRLKYVFDVSDTGGRENARQLYLWQYRPEHEDTVTAALENAYEISGEHGLADQLEKVAVQLADEYWMENQRDILHIVDDSFLEEYDDFNIGVAFRSAATVSITYSLMSRCGLEPETYFDHEDFLSIFDFNTPAVVNALGTAVSQSSQQVLRQIGAAIKHYEYERSQTNERTDLYPERRLPDSQPDLGGTDRSETPGQVRQDAEELSEGASDGVLQQPSAVREADGTSAGDRRDSEPAIGADDAGTGKGGGRDREPESQRPDAVGGPDEQLQGPGRGNDLDGTYIQLTLPLFLSEQEQIKAIDEAESRQPSAFSMPQAEKRKPQEAEKPAQAVPVPEAARPADPQAALDAAIQEWNGDLSSKHAVVRYMKDHAREKGTAAWLKQEYGDDLPAFPVPSGFTDVPWPKVQRRIAQLIKEDRFYTQEEHDNLDDIDPVAIREALAQRGIVNGELVDPEALERDPFIQQVTADAARIAQEEEEPRFSVTMTSDAFPDPEDAFAIWDSSIDNYYADVDGRIVTFPDEAKAEIYLAQLEGNAVAAPDLSGQPVTRQGNTITIGDGPATHEIDITVSDEEWKQIQEVIPDTAPPARDPLAPAYQVGDTVYLDDKPFVIENIGTLDVQLRDPSLRYPVFRSESIERFERLLQYDLRNGPITEFFSADLEKADADLREVLTSGLLTDRDKMYISGWLRSGEGNTHIEKRLSDTLAGRTETMELITGETADYYASTTGIEVEIQDKYHSRRSMSWGEVVPVLRALYQQELDGFSHDPVRPEPAHLEGVPAYQVGDTVTLPLDDREISGTIGYIGDVDVRIDTGPYSWSHETMNREQFEEHLRRDERNAHLFRPAPAEHAQPEITTETETVYPGEKNGLPYDIVVERLHIEEPEPTPPTPTADNFRITDEHLGEGGPKQKFRANIMAIQLLKKCEEEHRQATPEEQKILSGYVGWGGLADAFDDSKASWATEYLELKTVLTPAEYDSARASTLNAHYTSPTVIKAIYEAVGKMGFTTGNILEPACGVGNFFGILPEEMSASRLYGVELDSISGRIAKQLYPKADITVAGFETIDRRDFYDLAIGNVPFGQYKVSDRAYDKLGFSIHDYFFAKALDQVRPGGVVAFVTSRYTMDKQSPEVRRYIAERAELLGAIRLPNNAFKANAGTDVVSDILFLQKRDRPIVIEPDWVHLGRNDDGFAINRYFVDHPEMILGRPSSESTQYGKQDFTVEPIEGLNLADQLHDAVKYIHGQYQEAELPELGEGEDIDTSIPADPNVKNYSYAVVDGEVYFRENSRMVKPDLNATAKERVKGLVELRECVQHLIELQLGDADAVSIRMEQNRLNHLYDTFTDQYGLINSRGNALAFADDSSYYLLCSLEVLDEEGRLERKADMFTKRTIKQHTAVTSVDTASEALAVSISEKARVDMAYMSQLTGKDEQTIADELRGVLFLDFDLGPGGYRSYQTADEFLSGNVRDKLLRYEMALEMLSPDDPLYDAASTNVDALKAAQPKDLDASEIDVRLGATWVDKSYIQQFMYELLDTPYYLRGSIQVNFSEFTAEWNITGKRAVSYNDVAAYTTYGTERANAYRILEDTLNLRDVRIYDTVEDPDGKERRVLNQKETTLAQQKQQAIKDAFRDWIWRDPERRQTLVQKYNEMFNATRLREYDGSHITFGGINPEIRLRPHQLNAIAHVLYGGNTLLAHEVGAGKTFEMVAAAMESKRLGLCQKSLFVVPNHLTEQWASEFLRLYPSANILVTTKKDFESHNRKKFCARIATGDYDAVIIGHSQFEKIPISYARQERLIQEQIFEITQGIQELKGNGAEKFSVKQLERTKRNLEARLEKLQANHRKDDVVTFEQLGVDMMFVDESDNYKNRAKRCATSRC